MLPMLVALLAVLPQDVTVFRDVDVIPMDEERVLRGWNVVVEGDRITAMGAGVTVPEGALVIDGTGRTLVPGLADLHVHVERDELDDLVLFPANGITTVRLMNTQDPWPLELAAEIRAGRAEGPTLFAMPTIGSTDDPDHARRFVESMQRMGFDSVKVQTGQPDWTVESYRAFVAAARELGMRVGGHLPRNLDIEVSVVGGQTSVAHAEEFLYTYFFKLPAGERQGAIEPLARMVADNGVSVMATLVAFQRIGFMWGDEIHELERLPDLRYVPPATRTRWSVPNNRYRARGKDAEDLKRRSDGMRVSVQLQKDMLAAMQAAGVRLLVGTDSSRQMPFVVHGFAAHDELRLLVESGLTAWQALRAGTANAAEYLGQTGEFGVVAVGARADLVLVEADPLADVANLRRRVGVMLRGRWMPREELEASLEELAAARAD